MTPKEKIIAIQKILFHDQPKEWDGRPGPKWNKALAALGTDAEFPDTASPDPPQKGAGGAGEHRVRASSFADPADVRAFKKCKERGGSDQDCFKVGDNGIGCWSNLTMEGTGPSCALPPEDMEEKWGSVAAAKHKLVEVTGNGKTVTCVLKDRMPRRANIKNGAGIDLNPDACQSLGLEPPIMIMATWKWLA